MHTESIKDLLAQIKASPLNAYIWLDEKRSLEMASESDRRAGKERPLEGWPIGIKDMFCMKGTPTQAASKILEGFVSPYESTVTQRLWEAGAVFMGKQNLDSFGMGSANTSTVHGPAFNPISKGGKPTSPGGSSGGGAAAVAAGLARVSIGTDTGGSCRQPAAWTGVVGFKPTYGLVSRYGVVAHASSLDCPGIMASSVSDVARTLQVIAGFDKHDSQTYMLDLPDFAAACTRHASDLKIASSDVGTGLSVYREMKGLKITSINLDKILEYCVECYMIISSAEAASNLSRYDGLRYGKPTSSPYKDLQDYYAKTRAEGFAEEVKRRVLTGTYVLAKGGKLYKRAAQVRQWIADQMKGVWDKYDVLIMPTSTRGAMTLEEVSHSRCEEMYKSDRCTTLASLIGGPAISVPIGRDGEGMPLGMQVVGPPFAEERVLRVASAIEALGLKDQSLEKSG